MRLRTAHRNKSRGLKRAAQRRRRLFTLGWREWLDKILPDLVFQQNYINEHSIFNRLMRRPEPLASRNIKLPVRGLPYYIEPDPRTSGAFQGPSRYFTVVDDIDFSEPMPAKPTKEFIYGEKWVAYRRLQ